MNKETLRMQMLAGVITEAQYKAKLNEENITDKPIVKDLKKKAFKFVNTSQVTNLLKKELDKLSPEEKDQLLQKLPLSEVKSDDFSSFSSTIDNVLNQTVLENKMDFHDKIRKKIGGYEPGEDPTKIDKAVGKVFKEVGAVNVMSMGFLPALASAGLDYFGGTSIISTIGSVLGGSAVAAAPVLILGGLFGGALLHKIGSILTNERDSSYNN